MSTLYQRAEIYDLIENDKRTDAIRRDWERFLEDRPIHNLLDVSIGTGGMTLPLQELGISIYGSDLSRLCWIAAPKRPGKKENRWN